MGRLLLQLQDSDVTPAGLFTATFNVPSSSNGDHTVKATRGSKFGFKNIYSDVFGEPYHFLNPTSGPVGTSVNVTGAGF